MSMPINLIYNITSSNVFKMSAISKHSCFESSTPLVDGCVDDVLFSDVPNV